MTAAHDDSQMMAFCLEKSGDNFGKVVTMPRPMPGPNEALIQVLRAGVCNTDLEILQGYMGFSGVLGHEFVGRVVQVNAPDEVIQKQWLGARVCGDINVGCASCDVCCNREKLDIRCPQMSRNHCPSRTVLGILNKNGTFAEYLTLPLTNLHKVPDYMDDATAVFAEPLAAACRIVEQRLVNYDPERPDKVAILGDGKLGLMIAEVLGREHVEVLKDVANASKPVMFGKHQHKLNLVKDSGVECKFVSEVMDNTAFNGVSPNYAGKYDVVVDATGSPAGLKLASGICRPMGTLVLKSTCAAGEQFNAAPFVIDELRVIGSRCGPINVALDLLAIGKEKSNLEIRELPPLRVEKYVTKTFPLAEAEAAIKCAAEKSTMKVQIICSQESS